MEAATTKRVMLGVNTKDGLGHIVAANLSIDQGNHLTTCMPVKVEFYLPNDKFITKCKFSYFNKFSNNTIFREE